MPSARCLTIALQATLAALALVSLATPSNAQETAAKGMPSIRLAIGFGVDTTPSPAREIFALWRSYLHETDLQRGAAQWVRAERERYPNADLLRSFVFQGLTRFTLVHLGPAPGEPGVYEFRTLVSRVDSASLDVYPLSVFAVYAVHDGDGWRLSNALLHRTRTWYRNRVGVVSYASPVASLLNANDAAKTAQFADSLGTAFGVTVAPIEYYAAESLSAIYAALGLDFFPMATDTTGGRALVLQRVVLVGGSSHAESNRHELTHVILGSLTNPQSHRLLVEGLATWVGGSAGLPYQALLPGLASWLSTHPDATLRDIMENPPQRVGTLDVGYDVFAVIVAMAHERGGIRAVRELVQGGPTPADAMRTIARVLGGSEAQVNELWRRRVRGVRTP